MSCKGCGSVGKLTVARMAASFWRSLTKGTVTDAVFDARQRVCSVCPARVMIDRVAYCSMCRCPATPGFAIRFKNTLRGWVCPSRDDSIRRAFEEASKAG